MFFHFHPYKPFVHKQTKKLIIGTLPPPRFCNNDFKPTDVNFCYGSKDNLLWPILDKIYNLNLEFSNTSKAVEQRKEFLIKNKIGICDIVESCKREKVDASDLGMSEIVLRDILQILKEHKQIDTLLFMGGSSKNSPQYFLKQILKQNGIKYTLENNSLPKIYSFEFEQREIKTVSLTSPSNAANRFIGSTSLFKKMKELNPNYTTFDFRVSQYEEFFKSQNQH